jgi:transcriptional regulator with XRE-family HTH domain
VTTSNTGPLIPRRRLGAAFKALREGRGETLQQTSKALLFSPSKLSRIENGSAGEPHPRDVRDLIRHFGVNGAEAAGLEELAEAGRQPGWWQLPPYEFTGDVDTFISYESAANRISEYSPMLVPGLLQTRDYARAVVARVAPSWTAEQVAVMVEGRLERQRQMRERRTPRIHVMDESALRRVVGSTSVMHEQLAALVDAFSNEHIECHIMPHSAGFYEALELTTTTAFLFDSPDDQDVVSIERIMYVDFLDRERSITKYKEILARLSEYWLDTTSSMQFIQKTLQEWRK